MSFPLFSKRPKKAPRSCAPTNASPTEEIERRDDSAELAQSHRFDRKLWQNIVSLAKPYWFSDAKKTALGLLTFLFVLMLAVNGLNVVINFVSGTFMTALQEKNAPEFYKMLAIYFGIFVVGTPIVVLYSYVENRLGMKWREWLTHHLLDKYFQKRKYYHVNNDPNIDNPDERIAQDVSAFCKSALSFTLVIIGSIITFASFITILWKISTPLVSVVVVYAFVGTLVTYWIGRRLMGLNFNQLKKEANFRFGLIHVRNNTESIAFYQGEEQEKAQVKQRFSDAIWNFNMLIGWTRNLGFVTTGYNYLIVLIPALIIAPIYFAGKVKFGVFTQADMAFSQILAALSLVVSSFSELSTFAAVSNRLAAFSEALDDVVVPSANSVIDTEETKGISLKNVTLMTPNSERLLVKNLSLVLKPHSGLLIVGPSGSGKSSILRAIAGLWNAGSGSIERPAMNELMFLPQRPYMILGSLRRQLIYPQTACKFTDEELNKVLEIVNLAGLPERIGGFDTEVNFADLLSLGEQQRLAFARLLLAKPQYAILDEATSALDVPNEAQLYRMLQNSDTTVISVGHRPTLVNYHTTVLELKGDTGWSLSSAAEYSAGAQQVEQLMKNMSSSINQTDVVVPHNDLVQVDSTPA